eukprot:365796-Chlamydomonas_euryale.AAC.2
MAAAETPQASFPASATPGRACGRQRHPPSPSRALLPRLAAPQTPRPPTQWRRRSAGTASQPQARPRKLRRLLRSCGRPAAGATAALLAALAVVPAAVPTAVLAVVLFEVPDVAPVVAAAAAAAAALRVVAPGARLCLAVPAGPAVAPPGWAAVPQAPRPPRLPFGTPAPDGNAEAPAAERAPACNIAGSRHAQVCACGIHTQERALPRPHRRRQGEGCCRSTGC